MSWSDVQALYRSAAETDTLPDYTTKWDLAADPKLDEGVIYMATLNQSEPACWVMMGVVARKHLSIHLARAAFEKAVQLGSPQAPILELHLKYLNKYHSMPFGIDLPLPALPFVIAILAMIVVVIYYIFDKWRRARRKRAQQFQGQ
jgi:hypothetical protein